MKLKKLFVHYFVPHKRNKYKPHFLRVQIVGAVALAIVVLFLGATAQEHLFVTNSSPQTAAVVAATLVDLANADRSQNNLPTLTVSPQLQEAAQLKANDMAAKGYFAHESPDGHDPWYWFTQADYDFSYAGENLAVYFSDSDAVNTAWMNSPEHRANILGVNFTQVGIATAEGVYQGTETTFVVQEFGTPAEVAAASLPATAPQTETAPVPAVAVASTTNTPEVAGASIAPAKPKVQVIAQSDNFIAVKNENATAPTLQVATLGTTSENTNSVVTLFLKLLTSPQSDLRFIYEIIGAIVVLALMLEIGVEIRRQHPHRIVLGLSLIALMVVLVYADHAFFVGNLLIT